MSVDDWKNVQRRLIKLGFNPGSIDGVRGRKTVAAVKRFQASQDLIEDGIVGPKTYYALFGDPEAGVLPSFDEMPWYHTAIHLIGTREIAGPDANKVIMEMADTIDIDYADDDIPWCGLFVGHCVGSSLGDEPLPVNPLGARNWMKFGEDCEPQLGSVLVFWRGKSKKNGWQGHVGFYHGEDSTHYHVLGGNQSNSVNVMKLDKKRLLGARWPLTAGLPSGVKVVGGIGVRESENEA